MKIFFIKTGPRKIYMYSYINVFFILCVFHQKVWFVFDSNYIIIILNKIKIMSLNLN